MRHFLCTVAFLGTAATATAQIRLSGRIIDERSGTPLSGAVVRLTGSDSTMTTGTSGTFAFASAIPGRFVLTVAAPAYEFNSISLEAYTDTIVTVVMRPRTTILDPMVIRPRTIRVKGTVVDSVTGEPILFAQAGLFPEGRYDGVSNIGNFSFKDVPVGQTTLVFEAIEHVPIVVSFNATRDTVLNIKLPVDSVAVRMVATQSLRLAERARAVPYVTHAYDTDLIARERRSTIGELVDRMLLAPYNPRRRAGVNTDDACVFYDDIKVAPAMLDGMAPEAVQRVEIYQHGAMIRVYSKRYVLGLARESALRAVTYLPIGMRVACG
jgi:hypothetical protein